uniref:Uncharacterized protein n=1 Tax=Arundo donax TaxID=35708 RepID=A0A0A9CHS9_ARUDO
MLRISSSKMWQARSCTKSCILHVTIPLY